VRLRGPPFAALLALAIPGCTILIGPDLPDESLPYEPSPRYEAWWSLVERCSGLEGDLTDVRWRRVPGLGDTFVVDGRRIGGAWYGEHRTIVLPDASTVEGDPVRHEMLHALQWMHFQPTAHTETMFRERCGGLVTCDYACPHQWPGPRATTESPLLGPEELELSLLLSTSDAGPSVTGGWVAAAVVVRNPRRESVRVRVPTDVAGPLVVRVTAGAGVTDSRYPTSRDLSFKPGETKRFALDLHVTGSPGLAPGEHPVRGFFYGAPTPPVTLRVHE
jgi:hypothetical protein